MNGWVFPGQGSQFVGMGAALASDAAREVFAAARATLDWDVRAACVDGPADLLASTEVSQPAILTMSVAAARTLSSRGLAPLAVAGHSVGEFAALVAAGALSFEDAVQVVAARAHAMAQEGRAAPGTMAAVIGLPLEQLATLCEGSSSIVEVATINAPDQFVISGEARAVEAVGEAARAAGARRVIPLAVSVAAHSPLMAPAAVQLLHELDGIVVRPPQIPYVSCVSGKVEDDPREIARLLAAGVTRPVMWPATVNALRAAGVERFIEVGPGRVLSGLIKRIVPGARTDAVGSDDEAMTVARELLAEVRR